MIEKKFSFKLKTNNQKEMNKTFLLGYISMKLILVNGNGNINDFLNISFTKVKNNYVFICKFLIEEKKEQLKFSITNNFVNNIFNYIENINEKTTIEQFDYFFSTLYKNYENNLISILNQNEILKKINSNDIINNKKLNKL